MNGMMVDSNVLLDVFLDDARWGEWSESELAHYSSLYDLYLKPVIYSEISIGFHKIEELERVLEDGGFRYLTLPKEALFLAGKVFLTYRKNKGQKRSPLPDFYIGAHASVLGLPLLTRDPKRYATYFPALTIISPS